MRCGLVLLCCVTLHQTLLHGAQNTQKGNEMKSIEAMDVTTDDDGWYKPGHNATSNSFHGENTTEDGFGSSHRQFNLSGRNEKGDNSELERKPAPILMNTTTEFPNHFESNKSEANFDSGSTEMPAALDDENGSDEFVATGLPDITEQPTTTDIKKPVPLICPRRRIYQSPTAYMMMCARYGLYIVTFDPDPRDLMPQNGTDSGNRTDTGFGRWWNSGRGYGNTSRGNMFDIFEAHREYEEKRRNRTRALLSAKKKKDEERKYYFQLAGRLWKIISPLIIVLGTIGNVLSIAVMLRKAFRHTTMCFYLITLAITDNFVLYCSLLPRSLAAYMDTPLELYSDFLCKTTKFLIYYLSHVASWIVVSLTFERFVAVLFPHQSRLLFTKTRAALALSFIVLIFLTVDVHFFWTHHLQEHVLQYIDYESMTIRTRTTSICSINLYVSQHLHLMTSVWPWIDMALFSLVPFLFIISGNVSICVKLVVNHRHRRHMVSSNQSANQAKLTATSVILALVSLLFVLSTLPVTIWQFHVLTIPNDEDAWARIQVTRAAINLLQYVNNAFNFVLYCFSGRQFRKELLIMLGKRNQVHPIGRSAGTGTESTQRTTESNV